MTGKLKIVVAGIGGVGGYFGGLLAQKYVHDESVEVYFIARGEHLRQINKKGLTVVTANSSFTAVPAMATDCPAETGIADYLILCTKSYDLDQTLDQLKPCIDANTVILPLLNGVESTGRIEARFPANLVLQGCVYIVSRITSPGVIEKTSNIQKLFFGPGHAANDRLRLLENLFRACGIEATLSENIIEVIWKKFIYISPVATATSWFNNCIGELLDDPDKRKNLHQLIEEVARIALFKGVVTDPEIAAKTREQLKLFPYASTSSMHSDYLNHKKQTELETLTGYVVREGQKLNLPTPCFEKAYKTLHLFSETKKI